MKPTHPSSDESRLHDLFQQMKQADESGVPDFDRVVSRTIGEQTTFAGRWAIAAVFGIAATLLIVAGLILFTRQNSDPVQGPPDIAEQRGATDPSQPGQQPSRATDIDFRHLLQLVAEHFQNLDKTSSVPVWSSRTESLLAINLNLSVSQE